MHLRSRSKSIITLAVVGLLALGLAVPALAAEETPAAGSGLGGVWGGVCRGTGTIATAISELLGLSSDEISAQRQAGESLADIAASQGVSKDALVSTMLESRKVAIDEAVASGRISQEQADLMLQNMQTRIDERVSDPTVGPRGGAGGTGGGCGMNVSQGLGGGQGRGMGAGRGMQSTSTSN